MHTQVIEHEMRIVFASQEAYDTAMRELIPKVRFDIKNVEGVITCTHHPVYHECTFRYRPSDVKMRAYANTVLLRDMLKYERKTFHRRTVVTCAFSDVPRSKHRRDRIINAIALPFHALDDTELVNDGVKREYYASTDTVISKLAWYCVPPTHDVDISFTTPVPNDDPEPFIIDLALTCAQTHDTMSVSFEASFYDEVDALVYIEKILIPQLQSELYQTTCASREDVAETVRAPTLDAMDALMVCRTQHCV